MKDMKQAQRLSTGFSLFELLIACLILIILMALAYPNYQKNIIKVRRLDAQNALFNLANRLEHYYANVHSYENASLGTGDAPDVISSNLSSQKWYRLEITSQTADEFSLSAVPINSQANDQECQTFTLNHEGNKGIAAGPCGQPRANARECW
ncbi:pilus assembly protein PilE [Legionella jordanis]|uniref:Type-IV pilin n=2 Tax=Legionella jordanis TaxID=456 RepID=A0A0W0V8I4_9GAMM|nr:type-IV pilin [Legionella jordanis]RMX04393.1 pilus assembly protein PilE [Legionella jordanis]VEH12135.1 type IV pilin [Legionella jordanis]